MTDAELFLTVFVLWWPIFTVAIFSFLYLTLFDQ